MSEKIFDDGYHVNEEFVSKHVGKLESEKIAEEKLACRKIVAEINNFGISERQRLFLIYLLGLELEDREAMSDITIVAKELCKLSDGFLSEKNSTL